MAKRKRKLPRCYLCQQRVPNKAFTKFGYDVLKCKSCQLYSLKFKGNYQDFVREYYNEEFFTGSDERIGYSDYEDDQLPELINMKRYLRRIKRFRKTGKLLDVGCATGHFMEVAKESGFDPYGFDVSKYATKIARKKFGNRVKRSTVSSVKYKPKTFDLITMFDVVEHLEDPRGDLEKLHGFLKDRGLLVINTGDAGSLISKLQGKNWHFFVPPQHLFFFSKKTLSQLLNQAGFDVIKIEHKGKWLSFRYFTNLLRQIHPNFITSAIHKLFDNEHIGKLPIYLNLFDNIIVYAKKTPKK